MGRRIMADLETRIAQGKGDVPADIVLRGGKVFDLITGATIDGDVAICGDTIVGVADNYEAVKIINVSGLTLVPGFIDPHLHIESSLVTPYEFDRCVAPPIRFVIRDDRCTDGGAPGTVTTDPRQIDGVVTRAWMKIY